MGRLNMRGLFDPACLDCKSQRSSKSNDFPNDSAVRDLGSSALGNVIARDMAGDMSRLKVAKVWPEPSNSVAETVVGFDVPLPVLEVGIEDVPYGRLLWDGVGPLAGDELGFPDFRGLADFLPS